jgi:hypothetical protein
MVIIRTLLTCLLAITTVFGGTPRIGCMCSNGDIHATCPRLGQTESTVRSASCCSLPVHSSESVQGAKKSCCGIPRKSDCCCSDKENPLQHFPQLTSVDCHCTPVLISSNIGNVSKLFDMHDMHEMVAVICVDVTECLAPVCIQALVSDRLKIRPPLDLILLNQRWLI